jgi:hypothetical protein
MTTTESDIIKATNPFILYFANKFQEEYEETGDDIHDVIFGHELQNSRIDGLRITSIKMSMQTAYAPTYAETEFYVEVHYPASVRKKNRDYFLEQVHCKREEELTKEDYLKAVSNAVETLKKIRFDKLTGEVHDRGYTTEDINLVMSNDTRQTYYNDDETSQTEIGTKAAEHAGKGSAIGGTIGAIFGIIAAIGTSVLIPGLGILIAGPLAAGLAGAGAGGLAGGLIGALVGSGIPEARAKLYETGIKEGNVVLSVIPKNEDDVKYLEENWKTNKGEEIYW